jgi:RNA 3'-terminal phosphate cyclase (ATP)
MNTPVTIDGSQGEGGGQILRTSLALSIVTGRPLHLRRIRADRKRPGLQRQHLACVEAAVRLSGGTASTLELDAQDLVFDPGTDRAAWPATVAVDIGNAGSTSLVVQTVLLPALAAVHPVRATITGGTHDPPFEYLDRVFLAHLRAMGADVRLIHERLGLPPDGGGCVVLETRPSTLRPIEIGEPGGIRAHRATALVARLPRAVGDRQLTLASARLDGPALELREVEWTGSHNMFMVEVEFASGAREVISAQPRDGWTPEEVAGEALDELALLLGSKVAVGQHLADQLLVPMAIAGGGRFRTLAPLSRHATTNIETIRAFLDVPIRVEVAGPVADVIIG